MLKKTPTHAERIAHLEAMKLRLQEEYDNGAYAPDRDVYNQCIAALNGRLADIRIEQICSGLEK